VALGPRTFTRTPSRRGCVTARIRVGERAGRFDVVVTEGSGSTEHVVTVSDAYVAELGLADVDRSALIEASFVFLLEREPKESIMRTFELPVIARYFPEYPDEIRRRLTDA
jgi:hypothetical protein